MKTVINKEKLEAAKTANPASGPLERAKQLASTLPPAIGSVAKPSTIVAPAKPASAAEQAKRKYEAYAIKAVTEQTPYEKRFYMRDFHADEKPEVVRHVTIFPGQKDTDSNINQIAQVDLAYMLKVNKDTKRTEFRTSELINNSKTAGSAYGDVHRSAGHRNAKLGLVKMEKKIPDEGKAYWVYHLLPAKPAKTSSLTRRFHR